MKYDREQLSQINLYGLRSLAREVGVKSPTSLKKQALIEEIILIESGKKSPYKQTKKGRPLKKGVENVNLSSSGTKKELINSILKEIEKKLNEIL